MPIAANNILRSASLTLLLGLTACASGPSGSPTQARIDNRQQSTVETTAPPTDALDQAEAVYARTGDAYLRNQYLLRAAQQYADDGACAHATTVLSLLYPELEDNAQQTHANVLFAQCLLMQKDVDLTQLQNLLDASSRQMGFDRELDGLRAQLLFRQHRFVAAADALQASQVQTNERDKTLWDWVSRADTQALREGRREFAELRPWIELALIVRQHGLAPSTLAAQVNTWQRRYADEPFAQSLPDAIHQAINTPLRSPMRVSVLLPLSGRLASQGQAIKEGLLASYLATERLDREVDETPRLTFVDTALHSMDEVAAMLGDSDVVIGPLLKDNVAALQALLPDNVPLLALNRLDAPVAQTIAETEQASQVPDDTPPLLPDLSELPEARYYFALAPEDEALQMAHKIADSGARNLIVVADQSAATQRMAEAFLQTWRQRLPLAPVPALTSFDSNESLRDNITEALGVAQSKARIQGVERILNSELHSVTRNRRDIDAIVIFASVEQTELLNPIIEASLSPFGDEQVPVYASHRSYSLQRSKNSLRDLRNLTFTDMPWMLPGHEWHSLQQQTRTLWPQRSDTLNRLFAMGYDSYQLVPVLEHLRILPQTALQGLTGQLHVLEDGTIKRTLSYGKVAETEVIRLASR
ncbi:penicillin-binding protein activator [Aestuariibacter halophilus]|uniref:Penicillin-binding protein activator n=1 Tax=Fluctibacter halophilus TaxID=226011 RepID=A0ABS8GCP7_9ALTE|nr:penicillin-binding protein activator [Aestuariibacter halophilus]MCC2618297.1 penicillin-binding protein activator [Aestuariibacter halophilus]